MIGWIKGILKSMNEEIESRQYLGRQDRCTHNWVPSKVTWWGSGKFPLLHSKCTQCDSQDTGHWVSEEEARPYL
jgi:hypothetical protein